VVSTLEWLKMGVNFANFRFKTTWTFHVAKQVAGQKPHIGLYFRCGEVARSQ